MNGEANRQRRLAEPSPKNWKPKIVTKAEIRHMRICAGWKREVALLAREGYFEQRRGLKHSVAGAALDSLYTFISSDDGSEEKAEAKESLFDLISWLTKEKSRGTPALPAACGSATREVCPGKKRL